MERVTCDGTVGVGRGVRFGRSAHCGCNGEKSARGYERTARSEAGGGPRVGGASSLHRGQQGAQSFDDGPQRCQIGCMWWMRTCMVNVVRIPRAAELGMRNERASERMRMVDCPI